MDKPFRIGDKVEMVGNIPFSLIKKPRPLLGRVVNVNGYYIDVKPKYQRWIAEFYPCELKHCKEII